MFPRFYCLAEMAGTGKRRQLPDAGITEVGPVDGVPGEIQADEIAILGELFTVHHFAASRRSVLRRSDLRLVARLPGMPGDDAGSVQTNVVGIRFLLCLAAGLFGARETDHYGDGEAFFMTPFQISIERHVAWTLRAPRCQKGCWLRVRGDKAAISFAKVLAYV